MIKSTKNVTSVDDVRSVPTHNTVHEMAKTLLGSGDFNEDVKVEGRDSIQDPRRPAQSYPA